MPRDKTNEKIMEQLEKLEKEENRKKAVNEAVSDRLPEPSHINSEFDFDPFSENEMRIYVEKDMGQSKMTTDELFNAVQTLSDNREELWNYIKWGEDALLDELNKDVDTELTEKSDITVRAHDNIRVESYIEFRVNGMNVQEFWREINKI